jgi:photoactive yellow protein
VHRQILNRRSAIFNALRVAVLSDACMTNNLQTSGTHQRSNIWRLVLTTAENLTFETIRPAALHAMDQAGRDQLPFGAVGIDPTGITQVYNALEARMSGLDPDAVLGTSFFDTVAQCMNNFMVAQRFEDEAELDEIVPYVLTLRMRPTRVRLRLIADSATPLRFILIER